MSNNAPFHLLKFTLKLTGKTAIGLVEGGCWALHLVGVGGHALGDALLARRALAGGVLHCPAGHEVPTEGETYACGRCGFVYQGSIWICGNPECQAVSPYCSCPTCRLSIRNPYRWG